MQIVLIKNQRKSILSKSIFTLRVNAELTEEEINLVERYGVKDMSLMEADIDGGFFYRVLFGFYTFFSSFGEIGHYVSKPFSFLLNFFYGNIQVTIGKLMKEKGHTFQSEDFGKIMEYHNEVINISDYLHKILLEMNNFGGSAVYEHNEKNNKFELVEYKSMKS